MFSHDMAHIMFIFGIHILETLCFDTEGILMTLTFYLDHCLGRHHTALVDFRLNGFVISSAFSVE